MAFLKIYIFLKHNNTSKYNGLYCIFGSIFVSLLSKCFKKKIANLTNPKLYNGIAFINNILKCI